MDWPDIDWRCRLKAVTKMPASFVASLSSDSRISARVIKASICAASRKPRLLAFRFTACLFAAFLPAAFSVLRIALVLPCPIVRGHIFRQRMWGAVILYARRQRLFGKKSSTALRQVAEPHSLPIRYGLRFEPLEIVREVSRLSPDWSLEVRALQDATRFDSLEL